MQGRKIIVINPPSNDREDWMGDFVAIIPSFCACLYGQRRTKRQTEKIIAELEAKNNAVC
jgi:putative resolvase